MRKYNKTILFDFNDTIEFSECNNVNQGFQYLSSILNVPFNELLEISNKYYEKNIVYESIENIHTFMDEFEYIMCYFKIDQKLVKQIGYENIEYNFFKSSRNPSIPTETKIDLINLLEYFNTYGFKVYLLSNTWFSSSVVESFLLENNIDKYFDGTLTSGDCRIRKPSSIMLNVFKDKYLGINLDNAFLIGNKKETDWTIAKSNNINPILLGNTYFQDYKKIKLYLENNYLYYNSLSNAYSVVDGPGNRIVLYLQGCLHHCDGCHNQTTWDLQRGLMVAVKDLKDELIKLSFNKKVTISGGEPLLQSKALIKLLKSLKEFDLCLYTGFEESNIPKSMINLLRYVKVGKYRKDLHTSEIKYIGSTNQKFINLREVK
jgi:anaerobic ribonucleoside-triphosphate reductase activating protein